MSKLGKLFKRKPGGTTLGNLLRTGAKIVKPIAGTALNALAPGAGSILSALPIGEGAMRLPHVQEKIADTMSLAQSLPAQTPEQSKAIAKDLKHSLIAMGVPSDVADKAGAATYEAAAAPSSSLSSKSIKDEIKDILNGAIGGAKDGALDAFLNNTPTGQAVVQDATKNQINKYLPFVLGGAVLFLLLKRK